MIKMVMCVTRHPSLTREEFRDYWTNKHGPFFKSKAESIGAKRYVQSQTIDSPFNNTLRESRGLLPEFDGIAEIWFESEGALLEGMDTADRQNLSAALLEDERNFIDHAKSSSFLVTEHEM